ncbi:unnamed protein product [Amaranthus hypochondriacus]
MANSNEKSSSSSRKSKKSSSDKPKQPQRGLGVAQLEQIRLRSQLGCSGFTSSPVAPFQDELRSQGVGSYGVQQSSSYNNYYSQSSSPSTSSPYGHHPNYMMAFGDHERSNLRYQDSLTSAAPRWNPNGVLESSTYSQSDPTSRHFNSYFEDSRHERIDFFKNSKKSESSEHEEVDLELRLSI